MTSELDGNYWRHSGPNGQPLRPSNGGQISTPNNVVRNDPAGIPGGKAIAPNDQPPPPAPQR